MSDEMDMRSMDHTANMRSMDDIADFEPFAEFPSEEQLSTQSGLQNQIVAHLESLHRILVRLEDKQR